MTDPPHGLAANVSVSGPTLEPVSPMPRLAGSPQIVPPSITIGSATLSVPELSIVPSCSSSPLCPEGLEISRLSSVGIVIVPVLVLSSDQPLCREAVTAPPRSITPLLVSGTFRAAPLPLGTVIAELLVRISEELAADTVPASPSKPGTNVPSLMTSPDSAISKYPPPVSPASSVYDAGIVPDSDAVTFST